ncbi:MAG: ribbon-helix-helix protein, CopG family [Candidatus Undinarchaeales archaeon]|jgi:metal-responsive CopG/Arc/MetJ family transcriptional regulator|nr:ribbon-helix-helix protein, CopG family [Candidatus Undinarchaeales archaeon]MDP7491830.1 ribbon-helix-helix protein, CopG family [Candidatus Undinarchaeales archaeon]
MVLGTKQRMISLALDEELLAQLERVVTECNYSGRSQAVRDALRLLLEEKCDPARLHGRVRGTVTLLAGPDVDVHTTLRAHHEVVRSHIEAGTDRKGLLHVVVVAGDAVPVQALLDALGTVEGVTRKNVALF